MERRLIDLNLGEASKITKIIVEGSLKRRLLDMGITKGACVILRKVAPLGDPIEINIRGYELSLRKSEAERILVE